ncbi:MAG TPA: phosphatidate cytidylyltransferase [Spirochaetia bacterium]|nr:phosphatidate cytidylyltransferase [Spirochaetia bacterium]
MAFVPLLSSINLPGTVALLGVGTLFYTFAELSRRNGNTILVVSNLTLLASRDRDRGRFVLGPITLALGAMISLLLYPEPAASIAIYALAFGDGLASLVGTVIRGPQIPLLKGKTLSGSSACFIAVFAVTFKITQRPVESLVVAGSATVLEGIPTGNFDNLMVPVGVGLVASRLLLG